MKPLSSLLLLSLICVPIYSSDIAVQATVGLPRFPSINPDGNTIVFSWAGSLWKVSVKGGEAARLTDLQGDTLRSAWSRDGKRIAFTTSHSGSDNIYVMNADGTAPRQLTWTDRGAVVTGFCQDAEGRECVTFYSTLECDPFDDPRPFFVPVQGGDPQRLNDAYGDWPAVSPDGKHMLFTRGLASWLRRHQQTGPTRDVWLYDRAKKSFKKVTSNPSNDGQPRWLNDREFLFLSGRDSNCLNLFRHRLDGNDADAKQLTQFKIDDIQAFDVSANGKTAVLHVWDKLYTLDLRSENAEPQPLVITAAVQPLPETYFRNIDNSVSDAALSPDGSVMACIAYNEIFVRDMQSKSVTVRVTNSPGRKSGLAWSPDGVKLYFVTDESGKEQIHAATVALTRAEVRKSSRKGDEAKPPTESDKTEKEKDAEKPAETESEKATSSPKSTVPAPPALAADNPLNPQRWKDAIQFNTKPVLASNHNDTAPSPSRDGRKLAYRRDLGQLMMLDLATGESKVLREGCDANISWSWSFDSAFLAFSQLDADDNRDVWVVPVNGSASPVNVSQHPAQDYNPSWSADGKILSFLSSRIEGQNDIWSVNLDRSMDRYNPRQWEDYYRDAVSALKRLKPLPSTSSIPTPRATDKSSIAFKDLDDAYLRLRRITRSPISESGLSILPGGDRFVFRGSDGAYTMRWDGTDYRKLNVIGSPVDLSLQGDRVVTIENGRVAVSALPGGEVTWVDVSDRIRINRSAQNTQMFREAARVLGLRFYHPTMKNLDWTALTDKYTSLISRTQTTREFSEVANRFLGEINASHMGIKTPDQAIPNAQSQSHLGIAVKKEPRGYLITAILPDGPIANASAKLQEGDLITGLDDGDFADKESLSQRLEGKNGKEIFLSIERHEGNKASSFRVLATPVPSSVILELRYKQWWQLCADRVKEWSKGKLGYGHIRRMNEVSLDVYERDLYAAANGRDGMIMDVRNNHGGHITDRILASLMAPRHAYTLPRGTDSSELNHYPRGYLFIQRYVLPINALCNGQSGSNAEIFSHAIKTLKRGTLIGEPTQGAVISTGEHRLMDGTTVRMPTRGWFLPDGTDMENTPAVPDILIVQTPEAETAGDDPQLRTAVEDLLKRLAVKSDMAPPRYDLSVPQRDKTK